MADFHKELNDALARTEKCWIQILADKSSKSRLPGETCFLSLEEKVVLEIIQILSNSGQHSGILLLTSYLFTVHQQTVFLMLTKYC